MSNPVIHWFHSDLRLADNRALREAAARGPVIPVYILDDTTPGRWQAGGASRWWLHHSLKALDADLRTLTGGGLLLRRGRIEAVLAELVEEFHAGALCWNRIHEPWATALEERLVRRLGEQVELVPCSGRLLFEPGTILNQAGEPFRVYTPFRNACMQAQAPAEPAGQPQELEVFDTDNAGDTLADWQLLPQAPDWAQGFAARWQPGEDAAHAALERFIDSALGAYDTDRDRPDRRGTSRLSPHLHFGELSPGQVWSAVHFAMAGNSRDQRGAEAYLRELLWREFSFHLLHAWPTLPEQPFREAFADFPWAPNAEQLAAWQQGRTGYPLVDAGMRELWQTGWMHNRVRMVVASFLTKHLLQPWQDGEAWFHDTLVDADLANNSASWQWVAGCGADAAPYFRIFNPVMQGRKFDPDGSYVRRWVPELANVPDKYLQAPWEMPAAVAAECGVGIGRDYPAPLVDHREARERALAAWDVVRSRG